MIETNWIKSSLHLHAKRAANVKINTLWIESTEKPVHRRYLFAVLYSISTVCNLQNGWSWNIKFQYKQQWLRIKDVKKHWRDYKFLQACLELSFSSNLVYLFFVLVLTGEKQKNKSKFMSFKTFSWNLHKEIISCSNIFYTFLIETILLHFYAGLIIFEIKFRSRGIHVCCFKIDCVRLKIICISNCTKTRQKNEFYS